MIYFGLRIQFSSHAFGEGKPGHDRAEALLELEFTNERELQAENSRLEDQGQHITTSSAQVKSPPKLYSQRFLNFYIKVLTESNLDELNQYLQGINPMNSPDINNPRHALDWWKVCIFFFITEITLPIILTLSIVFSFNVIVA